GVLSRDQLSKGAAASPQQRAKTLRAFLASLAPLEANAVILLDEAQNVAPSVLTEVTALAAAVPGTLQLVLSGQRSLTRVLAQPQLRHVDEQIGVRVRLGPLSKDEVPGYVMHRVQIAATRARIEFDDAALDDVYEVSHGVPRTVNQLCDRALARAHQHAAPTIDAGTIATAAEDLGLERPAGKHDLLRTIALGVAFVLLM